MATPLNILFVGTYPPVTCGIATFTASLVNAVHRTPRPTSVSVAAIERFGDGQQAGPQRVAWTVPNSDPNAYERLAEFVNRNSADVVCLQHEYGLFPGDHGDRLLQFLENCNKPVVTTCHTILARPYAKQAQVLRDVAKNSAALVVMANKAVDLLDDNYQIRGENIEVIPHGVPDVAFAHRPTVRRGLNLTGRKVISTFGLINRGKGLDYMIRAMHAVLSRHPEALYLIIGRTHPGVIREEGESYRQALHRLAGELPNPDAVRFIDRFLDTKELIQYLQATDAYVTPYVNYQQITSGTLSYALAAGNAVVSSPYIHAEEALADGVGLLVGFRDVDGLAEAVCRLLDNPALAEQLQSRAYQYARRTIWPQVGRRYVELFDSVVRGARHTALPASASAEPTVARRATRTPPLRPSA